MKKHIIISTKVKAPKIVYPLIKAFSRFGGRFSKSRRFSLQVQSTIMSSREEASQRGNNYIEIEHLFLSILKRSGNRAIEILEALNCNLENLKQELQDAIMSYPQSKPSSDIPFTKQAESALKLASDIANEFNSPEIENEHLLLAILKQESDSLARICQKFNISYEVCRDQLKKLTAN